MKCECQITTYRPFIMGGNVNRVQHCENDATVLVYGKTPEEKKQPPMALCNSCYIQFKKRNKNYETRKLEEALKK